MRNPELEQAIDHFVRLYVERVIPLKTRCVKLAGRRGNVQSLHTMLGYELKIGRKRIQCPDQTTLRFLKIFAELGMPSIKIPYDPSLTSRLLPELEKSFQQITRLVGEKPLRGGKVSRQTGRIFRKIKKRLMKELS